ncbi:MAG TPA: hypothetical protein VFT12_15140 [Thermoanaerobaculia bacterium]|nr:hypothetical protein [Thermoanaerobaculia bacterium]
MFTIILAIALSFLDVDRLAREDAERDLDAAMAAYVHAIVSEPSAAPALERLVSERQIALHAIYERDRMRQIGLAADLAKAAPADVPRLEAELAALRAAREEYLLRRTAIEVKQQLLLTSAVGGRL